MNLVRLEDFVYEVPDIENLVIDIEDLDTEDLVSA
mgnify:FL=1